MRKLPSKLEKRLQKRKDENSFRELKSIHAGIDFYSNDYLGFSKSKEIFDAASRILTGYDISNGATGSRLLSGNHRLFKDLENQLASFHNSQSALVFNSGYDANIGFFSSVPQKNDIIFYDELSHASIRDGLQMSLARKIKFRHNDLQDLEKKLKRVETNNNTEIYIATESVFSMDGDSPDLKALVNLAESFKARLIVDEAHGTGLFGPQGEGLVQELKLEKDIFARIHTFGKAIGAHGATILGDRQLKDYLVNFSRSFIYTTALPPHTVATIISAYRQLEKEYSSLSKLKSNISFFRSELERSGLASLFVDSISAIQVCMVSGNSEAKALATEFQQRGFEVKAILSPTVPEGQERLRFCLHSYNSKEEISEVIQILTNLKLNE
ncbi:pyridoxal phosphate-dependent aminotransferase family protein [Gramella sp. BOM4]|nr:pyridoxal phosphate-dependent aminotransferase family protein [Christiangramia bathymodioli]